MPRNQNAVFHVRRHVGAGAALGQQASREQRQDDEAEARDDEP